MTLLLLLRPHGASYTPPYSNPVPFAWSSAGDTPPELQAELAFTTVLCKSTGEPVDILDKLAARQLTQQLNLPASYTITMDMDDDSYPFALLEQAPRIKVYRVATPAELALDPTVVNKLVFYGSLPSEGVDEDSESGMARLTFQEPSWVLNDRYVSASVTFSQVDQGDILWGIINTENAKTNGDTWIRHGSTTTGTLRDRTYDAGKEVAGLIDEMTKVDGGCDVSLTPVDYWALDGTRGMAQFNAYAQRGQNRPAALFVSGATLDRETVAGIPANCFMRRTRAKTITSATSVGSADSQTYANTTSSYGLLEAFETFSDVSISQTLLDKSVGKVANGQNAPMILEVNKPTREAPTPLLDYALGDTVYATCRRGGMAFYSLPVRVHGIDMTISQNGDVATKPTLATLPETIVSPTLPPGSGGGSGGGSFPPGAETISQVPNTGAAGTAIYPDASVTRGGHSSSSLSAGAATAWSTGQASGLVTGRDYTITAYARGNDTAPALGGTVFQLFAESSYSANDAAHIWNTTLATRQTWTPLTVTFTAPASTATIGFLITTPDHGVKAYTVDWTIAPA